MVSLEGPYVKDRLEGKGRVEYRNGDVLHAWFSAGTLHGFSKLVMKEVQMFVLRKRTLFAVFQGGYAEASGVVLQRRPQRDGLAVSGGGRVSHGRGM